MLYYYTSSDGGHIQLVKCPEVLLTTHETGFDLGNGSTQGSWIITFL